MGWSGCLAAPVPGTFNRAGRSTTHNLRKVRATTKARMIIQNLHKNKWISKLLCFIGRHDYEFINAFEGNGHLECFYCFQEKTSGAPNDLATAAYLFQDHLFVTTINGWVYRIPIEETRNPATWDKADLRRVKVVDYGLAIAYGPEYEISLHSIEKDPKTQIVKGPCC